jgi:probable DNA metabolism protein
VHDAESTVAYDGSFPGFLCACAEALNAPEPSPRVVKATVPETLFEERCMVKRDDERAAAICTRLTNRASPEAMRTLLEAFLSDVPEADATAALAMKRVRTEGAAALRDLSDPVMLALEKAARRAGQEAHMFCGLVRFSELSDGSWYAPVEPACDVLILIADHFAARFSTMRFAVHDLRRGSAVLHEPGKVWSLVDSFGLEPESGSIDELLSERERDIRRLWKLYFNTIAIESRCNPGLQSSRMPKHFWNLLTEMDGGR